MRSPNSGAVCLFAVPMLGGIVETAMDEYHYYRRGVFKAVLAGVLMLALVGALVALGGEFDDLIPAPVPAPVPRLTLQPRPVAPRYEPTPSARISTPRRSTRSVDDDVFTAPSTLRSRPSTSWSALQVRPDAYGLGVNADQYGAPHVYRQRDGTREPGIFTGGIQRDVYGPGVHQDQFGAPVYDSTP